MRRKIREGNSRGKVQRISNKSKISNNGETQHKINEETKGKFISRAVKNEQDYEDKTLDIKNDVSDWMAKFPYYSSVIADDKVDLLAILDPLKNELKQLLVYSVKKQELLQEESSFSDTLKSKPKKLNQAPQVADIPVVPKDAFLSNFWKFMEVFSGEISAENLSKLKASINTCDADFFNEPRQSLENVNNIAGDRGPIKQNEEKCIDERGFPKGANSSNEVSDGMTLGPLTQRLISCFFEEDHGNQGADVASSMKASASMHSPAKPEFMKSLQLASLFGSADELENQIQKKLAKYGILEDEPKPPEDKVLARLKKLQSELNLVRSKNVNQKMLLLNLAEKEMARQEILKKMQYSESKVC
ncbi:Transcriptional adapter 3, partial [Stegodyphus mimosarum]